MPSYKFKSQPLAERSPYLGHLPSPYLGPLPLDQAIFGKNTYKEMTKWEKKLRWCPYSTATTKLYVKVLTNMKYDWQWLKFTIWDSSTIL